MHTFGDVDAGDDRKDGKGDGAGTLEAVLPGVFGLAAIKYPITCIGAMVALPIDIQKVLETFV